MDISLGTVAATRVADRTRAARTGAFTLLAGTLLTLFGLGWDIQWHDEVGPDTFFTLSHLAIYSGSAVAGIASLVMVLLSTAAQRAGRRFPHDAGGTPVKVFGGTFHAPLGYLIAGTGAALFLLYGLLDLWWHSIYGFDAVLNTPSHVALFLTVTITMVGSIVVGAAARDRLWGRIVLLLAVPVMIVFAPMSFYGLSQVPLPVSPLVLGIVLCAPTLLIMGAVLLGPGAAIRIAVVLGLLQAALWWFSPWAAEAYARLVGLPLRDVLSPGPPELAGSIPMFLLVAALTTEAFARLGRTGRLRPWVTLVLAGAVAGFVTGGGLALQTTLTDPASHLTPADGLSLALVGLVLGPLAGFLGGRFAVLLRTAGPAPRATARPSANATSPTPPGDTASAHPDASEDGSARAGSTRAGVDGSSTRRDEHGLDPASGSTPAAVDDGGSSGVGPGRTGSSGLEGGAA